MADSPDKRNRKPSSKVRMMEADRAEKERAHLELLARRQERKEKSLGKEQAKDAGMRARELAATNASTW